MDALAAIVGLAQLGNPVVGHAELSPPWGLEVGAHAKTVVHLVQRGVCWLRTGEHVKPIRLGSGDAVLLPRGTRHWLSDDVGTACEPFAQALARLRRREGEGPGADSTVLLCAEYELDRAEEHPLLTLLPEIVLIRADMVHGDESISALSRLLAREASASHIGRDITIPRLVDTLLVVIVRAWLQSHPLPSAGWFRAMRDPHVGHALTLIHQAPEHRWTVNELASRVGQSRAAFARHFVSLVGEPPLSYVTRWRVNLAAKRLRTTTDSVEAIAADVGYDSATAFGKAFRKHFGDAPGRYRQSGSSPG